MTEINIHFSGDGYDTEVLTETSNKLWDAMLLFSAQGRDFLIALSKNCFLIPQGDGEEVAGLLDLESHGLSNNNPVGLLDGELYAHDYQHLPIESLSTLEVLLLTKYILNYPKYIELTEEGIEADKLSGFVCSWNSEKSVYEIQKDDESGIFKNDIEASYLAQKFGYEVGVDKFIPLTVSNIHYKHFL